MAEPVTRVLLVDDDPMYALLVRRLIEKAGPQLPCAAEWVETAEAAFRELRQTPYDLVLLDYKLPGADGLTVLRAIERLPGPTQPAVIMLTGSGSEPVAVAAMKAGAKDYLCKDGLDVPQLVRAMTNALDKQRLERQLASYHSQIEQDLQMAHELQLAFLPHEFPRFPRGAAPGASALEFHHRYQPTASVAGDFFYVLGLSDARAGLFICDVMGHGVRAALVTAMLRALVQDLAGLADEPGGFMRALNQRLVEMLRGTDSPLFATAGYAVVDWPRGELQYTSAGHPRPLLARRAAGTVDWLPGGKPPGGPVLGLFPDAVFPVRTQPVGAEDLVVLYTDGVIEVRNEAGEEFGEERLRQTVGRHRHLRADALFDAVLAELRAFGGRQDFPDDVCLLGGEIRRVHA